MLPMTIFFETVRGDVLTKDITIKWQQLAGFKRNGDEQQRHQHDIIISRTPKRRRTNDNSPQEIIPTGADNSNTNTRLPQVSSPVNNIDLGTTLDGVDPGSRETSIPGSQGTSLRSPPITVPTEP